MNIILFFYFFISLASAVPTGLNTRLYQGDIPSNSGAQFVFEFPHCPSHKVLLNIKKYEYELVGSDSPSTRIINIYAFRSNEKKCNTKTISVKQNYSVKADNKNKTHFYVTADKQVTLRRIEKIKE